MVSSAVDTHMVRLTRVIVRGVEPNVLVVRGHPVENSWRQLCERQGGKGACEKKREDTRDEKEPRVVVSHRLSVSFHWSAARFTLPSCRDNRVFAGQTCPRARQPARTRS